MKLRGKIRYYQDKYSRLFKKPDPWLFDLSLEQILELRLCDLKLNAKGSLVDASIQAFEKEWQKTKFRWRPYYWYSKEWFHPEGTNGIALPFYLSHPVLMAIEEVLFREVEGKNRADILKYLRHEAGHIVDKIYQLRYDKKRRDLFGKSSEKYPKKYHPVLFSRKFVKNLPRNYAQTHPDEDFAETFAIWLNPRSQWKKKYKGTAAQKLKYVDDRLKNLKATPPTELLKDRLDDASKSRLKLKTYYRQKAQALGLSWPEIEKQIYGAETIKLQLVKELVVKYAKSKTLTNYELRYLLSQKHSPLLHQKQILSYLQKRDPKAIKKQILKLKKIIEKKGIYFST